MELKEAIFGRKSIRKFTSRPVDDSIIKELIESAIYAPSASNKQAWKFIVINNEEIKDSICERNGGVVRKGAQLISQAPAGILVLYRNDVSNNYGQYKDTIQSASAAIQNLLLAAHEKGLGGCWICKLPLQSHLRKILEIPKYYDVIAYVALGYPEEYLTEHTVRHYDGSIEDTAKRKRKYSVDEVISYNCFSDHDNEREAYKYAKLSMLLHNMQLRVKDSEKPTISYKITKSLLLLLGERWVV